MYTASCRTVQPGDGFDVDKVHGGHQEFSTAHSTLVSFMQVLMDVSKQSEDGTASSSILTVPGNGHQKPS